MVNTRKGGGIDLLSHILRRRTVVNPQLEMNPPPNPPPAGTDAVVAAQMQLLQQIATHDGRDASSNLPRLTAATTSTTTSTTQGQASGVHES
jgi:hypothetical protein